MVFTLTIRELPEVTNPIKTVLTLHRDEGRLFNIL
jgi:hypothetical protein